MKRFIFLSVMIFAFLSSCGSKDDDKMPNDATIEKMLVGRWKMIAIGLNGNNKEVERIPYASPPYECQHLLINVQKSGQVFLYRECPTDYKKASPSLTTDFTYRVSGRTILTEYPGHPGEGEKLKIDSITDDAFELAPRDKHVSETRFKASVVKYILRYERIE